MSNKKQSSIEWLEWQINLGLSERGLISAFKEAKAMHKEEIEDAYCKAGLEIAHNDSIKESGLAQLYFNETFGGNND